MRELRGDNCSLGGSSGTFICRGTKLQKIQAVFQVLSDIHTWRRLETAMSAVVHRYWICPTVGLVSFIGVQQKL